MHVLAIKLLKDVVRAHPLCECGCIDAGDVVLVEGGHHRKIGALPRLLSILVLAYVADEILDIVQSRQPLLEVRRAEALERNIEVEAVNRLARTIGECCTKEALKVAGDVGNGLLVLILEFLVSERQHAYRHKLQELFHVLLQEGGIENLSNLQQHLGREEGKKREREKERID